VAAALEPAMAASAARTSAVRRAAGLTP
jgi:hypothetical protein